MKSMILACVATITLSAVANGEVMAPEPDWDKICFAISNSCVREERSGKAWMAIAATKLECELSSDQMLNALRLCIEGLGDGPQETRACERIVESMSSLCGTNALPYVEYLIEKDRRDGVAYCAYLQFIRMNPDLNRRLFFAEKMLDPKAGRGDGTRIAVYKDLSKIWKQVSKGGDSSNKAKLTWFFERRMALDKDFDHLVPQDFVAARRAAVKKEELDWNSICFMISNRCIRARHPEDAWMTIAAAKIRYKLSPDQMLEAFKRCIDGLGDSPQERMACARIVHCMNDNCGTNALPYVEYLIENDRRDGVAECAYRQLVKMETNLDRRLLFAEKILDPKSGHGNCSRIVVYQELCDIWARTERDGKHADKVKLTAFFERRSPLDRDFKYLAPQDFRPVKRDDEIDWTRVCYGISNAFINAKPPRDAYMRFAGTRNNYNLTRDQLLTAFERCLNGLGDEGRELKACEQIVSCLGEVCGTNAIPCLERLAITDRRASVASCAFRELMKMKPFAEGANRPATLQEFRATKKESGR